MATMERIVVGGDHTPSASAALRWAVGEAAQTGACVSVVHAFDVSGRADLALERDLERARRDARYRTQCWVIEVLGELSTTVPVIVSTPDASVPEALTIAARGARLVVIGRPQRGHNDDLPALLAAACTCPVMTVAADDVAVAV
ncbi:MAG TPA: universal stress protein [Nocardioidaceae bacterium]|nr:universal stress protein [Nocardioidaceae bacterium]